MDALYHVFLPILNYEAGRKRWYSSSRPTFDSTECYVAHMTFTSTYVSKGIVCHSPDSFTVQDLIAFSVRDKTLHGKSLEQHIGRGKGGVGG